MMQSVTRRQEVNFPKDGWIAVITLVKSELYQVTYVMYPVFISLNAVQNKLQEVRWEFDREGWRVDDKVALLAVEFDQTLPLVKKYWAKPTIKYSANTRVDEFKRVFGAAGVYKVLVTPNELGTDGFGLVAALPVKSGRENEDILRFMTMTDFPVNPRAASAGIYKVVKTLEMNWQTGEVRNDQRQSYPNVKANN